MALTRWPTSEPATRGSNTTGTLRVVDLARVEPLDRALAGAAADLFRRFEIGGVQRGGIIVVALHAGAFAGDRRHRDAVARAEIGAAEAVAGHQHHAADAGRRGRAAGFAHALHGERRPLRRARAIASSSRRRAARGSSRSRSGKSCASSAGSARPAYWSSGATRAIATARSAERRDAVAASCRWSRPPPGCGRPARAGRCRRLRSARIPRPRRRAPRRLRHAAHRHRVGGIGAGRSRGLDQPLRERGERRLIEQVGIIRRLGELRRGGW